LVEVELAPRVFVASDRSTKRSLVRMKIEKPKKIILMVIEGVNRDID
jgi:hypothetical protein